MSDVKLNDSNVLNDTDKVVENEVLSNWQIIKNISLFAYPIAFSIASLFIAELINFIFLKKFNNEKMIEGIGLANMYNNCILIGLTQGFLTGFDTLGSTSFGIKNYRLFGYYYQRILILCYIFGAFILILSFFIAEHIFKLFNFSSEVEFYGKDYFKISIFFVLFDILSGINFKYLNIIEYSHINTVIMFITLLFHPLWSWIAIDLLDLGVIGAAISLLINRGSNSILSFLYIVTFKPCPESMFYPNKNSFTGFLEILKTCIPAMLMLCAELWAFEILGIICIFCGELDYSSYVMLNNVMILCFTVTMGFNVACTIIVGKYISINNLPMIFKIKKICLIYGVTLMFIIGILLVFLRYQIMNLFIDKDCIIEYSVTSMFLIGPGVIFDNLQGVMQGYFRGLGKFFMATIICMSCFYFIMIGFSIIFALVLKFGIIGIWISYLIGCIFMFLLYVLIEKYFFDYGKIYLEVSLQLSKDNENIVE